MLTDAVLEQILDTIPRLRVGVLGDLFLDRYLDLDARLTEPSLETGLDAYQVASVRSFPGAAGTVINNLAALGVAAIHPIAMIGDDGEGYELRQALRTMTAVVQDGLFATSERRTPTYTKPMLCEPGQPPRELNRLDIKNRRKLPEAMERRILGHLESTWPSLDVLLVLDQVSEADCGVVTSTVRDWLTRGVKANPERFVVADSRERIGLFRGMMVKPNERECCLALGTPVGPVDASMLSRLANQQERTVFCTVGDKGMLVAEPREAKVAGVPAFRVNGPIDTVGAGDSTNAALACALAAGSSKLEAAAFGCLVASITIQQLGTTGTASPHQVRERWRETRL
jgi:sugar/nucleoside kinase (ribokinase family)